MDRMAFVYRFILLFSLADFHTATFSAEQSNLCSPKASFSPNQTQRLNGSVPASYLTLEGPELLRAVMADHPEISMTYLANVLGIVRDRPDYTCHVKTRSFLGH